MALMHLVLVFQAATMVHSLRFITPHNSDRRTTNSIINRCHFGHSIHTAYTNAPSMAIGRRALEMTPSDIDMDVGKFRGEEEGDIATFLDEDEDEDDAEEGEGDEEEDEDGEEIGGEVEEDDSDDDKEGLWQERRLSKKDDRERKAMILRSKLSWEQRYEDDPLKSDKLAKILEPEVDNYLHTFVALGNVATEDLAQRQQAWVHHMQWARRSALLPDTAAKVMWEYTRLAADCMGPTGQVLGLRANSSEIARNLLAVEPLFVTGAVREWQLFEFHQFLHENVSSNVALHDPKLSLGFFYQNSEEDEEKQERHRNYHLHGGVITAGSTSTPRVAMMGRLVPCDDEHSSSSNKQRRGLTGNLVLFNAKTNADAERYMTGDPMSPLLDRAMSSISVVNEQDVDGLNHLMPRTFGEKTVLDQVHFMDPEDLLELAVDDLAGLETHRKQNKEALRALEDAGLSFRYSRLGLKERYGTERAAQRGKEYNAGVELTQKVRMLPSIEGLDIDGDDIAIAVASEDFSAGGSDDN